MKNIKVLGTGCAKCTKTVELIKKIANELNIAIEITKETDPEVIMGYGVMSTPAVVIDEKVIHTGSVPKASDIQQWLASA